MNIAVRGLTPTQAAARERHLRFRRDIAEKAEALAKSKLESACDQMLAAMAAQSEVPVVEAAPVAAIDSPPVDPDKPAHWFGPVDGIDRLRPVARQIQDTVCRRYKVSRALLLGPSRRAQYVRARWIAFHLCRELMGISTTRIGHLFGDRDHTTVIHGIHRIARALPHDPDLAQEVTEMIEQLGGRPQ